MEAFNDDLIPQQHKGSKMDAVEERILGSQFEAMDLFSAASKRLLLVNEWGRISGLSEFRLFDNNGTHLQRFAEKGDYIRIDIPGPGNAAGGGYDWVKIEEISKTHNDENEIISMRVRPSDNPEVINKNTAHFLQNKATSTFLIRREGKKVYAEEHGRNEIANTHEGSLIDKGRNLIVGFAAKLGLSYPQWKMLVKGLLDG